MSDENLFGQYHTIKELLVDLDRVFLDIETLMPKNSTAQGLVRKFGPYLTALWHNEREDEDAIETTKLESWGAYDPPSFLISFCNWEEWDKRYDTDYIKMFEVATKMDTAPYYRPAKNHTYYDVTLVLQKEEDEDPIEAQFYAEIDEAGKVTPLPTWHNYSHYIPARKRLPGRKVSGMKRNGTTLAGHRLEYPDLTQLLKRKPTTKELKETLVMRFCAQYNRVMRREHSINIIVKKGGRRITLSVPRGRWKYFFRDRFPVLTRSGRKKPIFHEVISHYRHQPDGSISTVKTHQRGVRHFWWDDYEIQIIMPGKHAMAQASFSVSARHVDAKTPGMIDLTTDPEGDHLNKIFEGRR